MPPARPSRSCRASAQSSSSGIDRRSDRSIALPAYRDAAESTAPQRGRRSRLRDMDLRDTPEEAAFRAGLHAWLLANLPEGRRGGAQRHGDEAGREWSRALYEGGYAGLTWPKEYGGAGAP